MEKDIELSVIIVNYNAEPLIERCLASIYETPPSFSFEVIVIDNGSKDNSVAMIKNKFPQVVLVANSVDLHYSKGMNQGIRKASGRLLFCLNPDTVVFPLAFDSAVNFIDKNSDIGVVGSRLLNPDLSDQGTSRKFPTPMSAVFGRKSPIAKLFPNNRFSREYTQAENWKSSEPYEVDWLSSAAMLLRREVVDKVGGLDEGFYYWVDADWCHRIKKAGYKIYCLPESQIIHDEGKGSGVKDKKTLNKDIIDFHWGAYRYYSRHYSMGLLNIMKVIAILGLASRAALMLTINILRNSNYHDIR